MDTEFHTDFIHYYNTDCMDLLKCSNDKAYDVAICDPPYGLKIDGQKLSINKNPKHNRKYHEQKDWDNEIPPPPIYFKLLNMKTENQIIWGGNYFTEYLKPTKAWIFWYKGQNDLTMSDGEMAWTSFDTVTRQVKINRAELIKQNTFHPTEKPYQLYRWILRHYVRPGDHIIDTHCGSASIIIAVIEANILDNMNLTFTGCEMDAGYFQDGVDRVKNFLKNPPIKFPERLEAEQASLQLFDTIN